MTKARKIFGVIVFFAAFWAFSVLNVNAQTPATPFVDHWSTAAGTAESTEAAKDACLAAGGSPFYHPSILSKRALGKNEVIRGIPTGACVEMALPDRIGGRGFVRLEEGRPGIYDLSTGKLLRLAECNNDIYKFVPFSLLRGLPGLNGRNGLDGKDGKDGYTPIKGVDYFDGKDGKDGRDGKDAFCSSKKCKLIVLGIAGGIAGQQLYYWWPCITGRQR